MTGNDIIEIVAPKTAFTVRVGMFEGPLDLLLSLIEERKMLISDVSITSVADEFLKYLEASSQFPMRQTAEFILVASTLLLLKSRALLPVLTLSNEEEGDIKDLETRLKLLQFFRETAKSLVARSRMYICGGQSYTAPVFSPPTDLSLDSLREAAGRVLDNAPQTKLMPEVEVKSIMSLEDMMVKLEERVMRAIHMTFKDFAGSEARNPHEIVVGFLAMLELVKRGLVAVEQESVLGEIRMNYNGGVEAPKYG